MSFKPERVLYILGGVSAHVSKEGLKIGKEQSPAHITVQIAMGWPAWSRSTLP